ncbi:MAG: flagellar biosynthesis protein FliC, partial [Pseudomonadota bacterium]
MPLVINTNVSALNSQRQLARSGMDMDQAMERLSSGRRVNNAADDAAGLAIANRMTSQILGLNQAIRNANDGVSLIQTAEGALDETTNILQRMRELSIQAANGIYSDTDRATLDAEVQQLKSELDRIAESTTFNGQVLLDGSLGNVTLQVGSESEDTISLSVGAMDTDTLGGGNGADVVGIPMNTTASQLGDDILNDAGSGQSLSINGQNVGDLTGVENMNDLLDAVNAAVSGIEVTSFVELTASADGTGVLRDIDLILTISDLNSEAQIYRITDTGNMNELAQKITDVTGGVVTATIGDNGRLQMTSDTAASITASNTAGTEATTAAGLGTNAYRAQLALEITDDSISDIDIDIVGSTNLTSGTEFDNITQGLGLQDRDNGDITSALFTAGGTAAIIEGDLVINDVALSGMADGTTASQQAIALAALI